MFLGIASVPPALLWFLFGISCFVLELLLPGLLLFFFGIGAWCAALGVWLVPMPLSMQILIFLSTSIVTLVLLRARFQKMFKGTALEVDVGDDFVPEGAIAEVVEDIVPPAAGKVKYGGTFWQAVAEEPVTRGERVRVLAKNNLSLSVEPLSTQGES